ncbi:MAG: hypothetical protein Ta2G_14710 [Termitinemataceae bacterium]|nr:MAG: hypothetical protein Ta2G_14710 [Termitinemataceae bacterium]
MKIKKLIFAALCAYAVFFTACGTPSVKRKLITPPVDSAGWTVEEAESSKYFNVNKSEITPLIPSRGKDSPALTIEYNFLDTAEPDIQKIINEKLYHGQTSANYYKNERFKLVNDYFNSAKSINDINDIGDAQLQIFNQYYKEVANGTVYPTLITIRRDIEYYSGGAHPSRERKYFVINTQLKRVLRASDIISSSAVPALENLIEEALRNTYDTEKKSAKVPLTQLGFFEDKVVLNSNFYLSDEGITFSWDPYDIAPYSMGVIEITLPYSKVNSLFTNYGVEASKIIMEFWSSAENTPGKKKAK